MGNNIILETKFVADIRGSFYIPSYQRGYRWSETEVVRLLDDIYQNGSYGKMSNDDVVNKPYMFSVMQTKTQWSQNTYMPYLKEADDDHLSRDEMGQYLVYDDVYIVCENNSYGVYRNDDDSLTDTVTISQNEAGIDTEDRIIKLKKYIANMK